MKLFVCGAPRSGTSILTELLSSHPRIALGMERFRGLYPKNVLDDGHFRFEHFFSFPEDETKIDDTNGQYIDYYKRIREKYDRCSVVGDKFPDLFNWYGYLSSAFPSVKFVFIVRNIYDVASSWNRRASNPRDAWPRENDYRVAVKRWNEAIGSTDVAIRRGVDVSIVKYEQLFEGDEPTRSQVRKRLFNVCGLEDSEESLLFHDVCFSRLDSIRAKRLRLDSFQVDYIKENTDLSLAERLFSSVEHMG